MITFKEAKSLKDLDSVSLANKLRDHFVREYPAAQEARLYDAIQIASYLHRGDIRRGKRDNLPNPPYIEHPLRVALRLTEFRVTDPDTIIAAVLHDTVEDHAHDFSDFEGVLRSDVKDEREARLRALEYVSKTFGFNVAKIVDLVTNPVTPEGMSKDDKLAMYHSHVDAAVAKSEEALIVKVSDFIDNAGSLHHHYSYDDPKAKYFINRYSPLIPLYKRAVEANPGRLSFHTWKVSVRLESVAQQFRRFQSA